MGGKTRRGLRVRNGRYFHIQVGDRRKKIPAIVKTKQNITKHAKCTKGLESKLAFLPQLSEEAMIHDMNKLQ